MTRYEQPCQCHDVCQIQEELRALRRCSDKAAGDRALPEIREQMIGCKMLLRSTGCR